MTTPPSTASEIGDFELDNGQKMVTLIDSSPRYFPFGPGLPHNMNTQNVTLVNRIPRSVKVVGAAAGGLLLASSAHAADYADVAAAVAAMTGLPAVLLPVALAFVTLAVGLLTIRFLGRVAKKGFSVS